jgi:hypothetical protein
VRQVKEENKICIVHEGYDSTLKHSVKTVRQGKEENKQTVHSQ